MLKKRPDLEQLVKAGLGGLVRDCMYKNGDWYNISIVPGAGLAKSLGIDSQEMNRLRRCQGGQEYLTWLRYEKEIGKEIPDHTITWFCSCRMEPRDLRDLPQQMSPLQVSNYLRSRCGTAHVMSAGAHDLGGLPVHGGASEAGLEQCGGHTASGGLKQRHDELLGLSTTTPPLPFELGRSSRSTRTSKTSL